MVEGANDISGQSGTLTIEGFSPSTAYDVEWHVFGTLGVLTIQQSNGTSNGNGKIDLTQFTHRTPDNKSRDNNRQRLAQIIITDSENESQSIAQQQTLNTILLMRFSSKKGKTTVANNLAVVMSQRQRRTILLDFDLRSPRINTLMGVWNTDGWRCVQLFVRL